MNSNYKLNRLSVAGSLLLLIPVLNIVGVILVVFGMKGLAEHYKDGRIYRNAVIGAIFGIIGFILLSVDVFSRFVFTFFPSVITGGSIGANTQIIAPSPAATMFIPFLFISLMALFFRKAFHVLSIRSGVSLFRTVGTLLPIGAVLSVLCTSLAFVLEAILLININGELLAMLGLCVGSILIYVAFILLVTAFFLLKSVRLNTSTTNNGN